MTDRDKQAALNAEVAKAMGRKILSKHTIPNLFAATPEGALAREEAEEWLLRNGYEILPRCNAVDGQISCLLDHDDFQGFKEFYGATLAEARATAICNAVRGMMEDKNG